MVVQCPQCGTQYRFDETRMSGSSASLRCRKCQAGIAVSRPDRTSPESAATSRDSVPPPRTSSSPPAPPTAAISASRPRVGGPASGNAPGDSVRTALLADEAREFRDFVQAELREAGYEVSVTDSGEEALLLAGSHRFDLVFLNAYLRRLLGIHVCERIKSNPALRGTPVILMGALLGPAPGKRGAQDLYGADDFIPTSVSREELSSRIARFSRSGGSAPVLSAPAAPEPAPAPAKEPGQGAPPATEDEAEIRRLARIMISDIEIYHPEKFARAVREGTFFEAFSEELGRGKEMIDRRFGHLSNRIQILAAGLRDSLEPYRSGGSRRRTSLG